jgi:hypothetical protein
MRDHPWHGTEILGGMFGCKAGVVPNISDMIAKFPKGDFYNTDQNFLKMMIYPLIRGTCMVHDEFFYFEIEKLKFPTPRIDYEFVGDVFDSSDKRDEAFWKLLI